ncbi:hypothetical protein BHE74_00030294 [Ensete ventricosum]|nr:hypothetical protein GW17_00002005 [Ensete ventricosum]RWW62595.1 hypothetical protein BHE74_00030294 [Ensete ventricosum]
MKATRVLLLCLLGLLTALGVAAGYQLRKRPGGSGTVKGSVAPSGAPPLLVNLTLIPSAAAQGAGNSFVISSLRPPFPISDKFVPMLCFCALFLYSDKFMICAVCLDGTVPGYHLHPGFGSGANSWVVNLELHSFGLWNSIDRSCKCLLQALLSGCSAGGLASILHCDEFRALFPQSTKVKCLADAGFFLDA